jgi:hypothetical protein
MSDQEAEQYAKEKLYEEYFSSIVFPGNKVERKYRSIDDPWEIVDESS